MATIALYANKISCMPDAITNIKKKVVNFSSRLSDLKTKTLQINESVCNLSDVINTIQASTQTQEEKINSVEAVQAGIEQFVNDAACIDGNAADLIRQQKNDFYEKYAHLKPKCEKSGWEKICDKVKKAGEWCREHWGMIVTVLAVIAIAVIAVVTFGVAVAAVAAIAGIISLVLCIADTICVIATGGKDLSDIFREKGWNVLADIFEGLQIGCDIVSILLPAGAAIKAMSKIGVKNFAKLSLKALKTAWRETVDALWKNGFKKSFKDGLKNFGKIFVKTFIFDIDDFTKVKDGQRVWNLMADQLNMIPPNKNWIIDDGELIPSPFEIPGSQNPNKLTTAELMGQDMLEVFPDTIPYNKGNADLTGFAVAEAPNSMRKFNIDKYLDGSSSMKKLSNELRKMNMKNADNWLWDHMGKTTKDFERLFGLKMTWHEDIMMKKCFLVPTVIHANVGHVGSVSNFKFIFKNVPDISALVGNKIIQFIPRFAIGYYCFGG